MTFRFAVTNDSPSHLYKQPNIPRHRRDHKRRKAHNTNSDQGRRADKCGERGIRLDRMSKRRGNCRMAKLSICDPRHARVLLKSALSLR